MKQCTTYTSNYASLSLYFTFQACVNKFIYRSGTEEEYEERYQLQRYRTRRFDWKERKPSAMRRRTTRGRRLGRPRWKTSELGTMMKRKVIYMRFTFSVSSMLHKCNLSALSNVDLLFIMIALTMMINVAQYNNSHGKATEASFDHWLLHRLLRSLRRISTHLGTVKWCIVIIWR